jgi:HD-like signal output (HDOD) protein
MIDNYEAEMELYSCTHSDIGAYLLGLWGFPLTIIEAVSYHHNPSLLGKEQLTLATIVHIADFLYYIPRLDVEHILNLNFEKQLLLSIDYFKTLRQMKFK